MAELVTITINATTMEGTGAVEPRLTITVLEDHPTQRAVSQVTVAFATTCTVTMAMPDDFPVWQVNLSFSRFDVDSGFFFQPRGMPSPVFTVSVARIPTKWGIDFALRRTLNPARFQRFDAVLSTSKAVDLKNGPAVGDLDAEYDLLSDPAQILAKAALLNLFSVLTEEVDPTPANVPWFSYVRSIVRIDQERFVATIDPGLFESVTTIVSGLHGAYGGRGYATEPDGGLALHRCNIPPRYNAADNLRQMATVKIPYRQGNVQLTVAFLQVEGTAVHLLDCDMDENLNLGKHFFDLIKHLFNGGTNPVAMHEYIVADSAQSAPDGTSTIDLGYKLV